jgi:hypothetical protein
MKTSRTFILIAQSGRKREQEPQRPADESLVVSSYELEGVLDNSSMEVGEITTVREPVFIKLKNRIVGWLRN